MTHAIIFINANVEYKLARITFIQYISWQITQFGVQMIWTVYMKPCHAEQKLK